MRMRESTRRVVPGSLAEVTHILTEAELNAKAQRRVCCIAECDVHRIGDDCGGAAGPGRVVRGDQVIGYACACCVGGILHE